MSADNSSQKYATPKKVVRSQTWDDTDSHTLTVASPPTPTIKLSGGDLFSANQHQVQQARELHHAQNTFAQHQSEFEESRDMLLGAIDNTSTLLADLRDFNKNKRLIHYAAADDVHKPGPSRQQLPSHRRSQSNSPAHSLEEADAQLNRSADSAQRPMPPALMRFNTTQGHASLPSTPARHASSSALSHHHENDDDDGSDESTDMSVLKLDLRVGSVATNPQALVRSLERSSVAQLLDGRMQKSERHLENLKQRLTDTQSKVLVTGDLNAGKSTFVNALLRRSLMPTDQQPCTTVFCEVLDASQLNSNVEEVHMLKPGHKYNVQDDSTFTRHTLGEIERIVAEAEQASPEDAPILKCYATDTRATPDSLLKNGIVDIALIDAPGLNRDSLKTTALFARQEEIDVVVFVVSAENHFTLSAKEFLWNASHDKAYVFIVVNKFESIKNKDKCRKLVLDQIRQLSPRTYEDAVNLVHFVDSEAVFGAEAENVVAPDTPSEELGLKVQGSHMTYGRNTESLEAFSRLEASLRDFVLLRRAKSKLLPSKTYMLRLLSDMSFLAKINTQVAQIELAEATKALQFARPELAKCQASQQKLEVVVEGEEDEAVTAVMQEAVRKLTGAIELIGNGKPATDAVKLPAYPGVLNVWEYAQEVRHALTLSLELALRSVEDTARGTASQSVDRVQKLGLAHLPDNDTEKRHRIFNPDVMFAKRRAMTGLVGLGLGAEVVEVQASDFFDAYHHFTIVTGGGLDKKKDDKANDDEMSLVSSVSLGLGALTLMGGKTMGAKTAVDAFVRISDLVGNPTARRWAAPVLALVSTGLVVYFIYDLPNSIPRNIGRSIKSGLESGGLLRSSSSDAVTNVWKGWKSGDEVVASFTAVQSARVGRETRKVLRLASWDLQERFRVAIGQRRAEVEKQESKQTSAKIAIDWFDKTTSRVIEIKEDVDAVKGLEA
ncbi:probable GTP-binding protein, required for biogenesis of mitochondria [Melanopsichium pennsylvanicum]|uniref:GTP-binding protein, required for biogenesis of mitochondria n=2 Tax=Melanopsichium pennsylvanicum TaxID=63383 RepID=A0A077RE26_9BASI|nr:GTP-binding protein, required for biogenesis of mitochondria [Melanopsichium pennsylvanicum 4]SNX87875.1 probable GTP-binding protein, required for biogenesis of mitochondria [Melanopsichium pennsylvanicum]